MEQCLHDCEEPDIVATHKILILQERWKKLTTQFVKLWIYRNVFVLSYYRIDGTESCKNHDKIRLKLLVFWFFCKIRVLSVGKFFNLTDDMRIWCKIINMLKAFTRVYNYKFNFTKTVSKSIVCKLHTLHELYKRNY